MDTTKTLDKAQEPKSSMWVEGRTTDDSTCDWCDAYMFASIWMLKDEKRGDHEGVLTLCDDCYEFWKIDPDASRQGWV